MPTDRQLHETISRWLEAEAPMQLPDRVLRATFERTRKTRQRAGWQAVLRRLRMTRMTLALGGIAAVLVVAFVALGLNVNQPGVGEGATPTPRPASTPSPEASVAERTSAPEPSVVEPTAPTTPPALAQIFTSEIHGMSVMYPGGWNVQPATEPWSGDDIVTQESPFADVIYEKEHDSPFIALASQPLGGQSFDDWADAYLTTLIADDPSCANTLDTTSVVGAAGAVRGLACDELGFLALVSGGERGYLIWLYRVDDREWFDEILATVRLRPAEARLAEGPFELEDTGMTMRVTIPASGWTFDATYTVLVKGTEVRNLPEAAILFWHFPAGTEFFVPGDPCQVTSTKPDTPATTVDEFAAALAAQASRDASEPEDVTVGGYAGKSITLHVPADAVPDECEQGEFVSYGTGTEPANRVHQGPGQIDELWILDVDGGFVTLNAMYRPDTPPELVEELRAIAESATFETP